MKKWIILFVAFLLTGCAGNTSHLTYTVNDEYELIRTSGNAFELFPRKICICHTIHPCKITDIAWDDKYIIAKQTEEKSDPNNPDAAIANKKVNIIGLLM